MPSKTFITAVGRRKTAIASVRLLAAGEMSLTVNGKTPLEYFKTTERAKISQEALSVADLGSTYAVFAQVSGGGVAAQADAVRHAISRALTKAEPKSRGVLKAAKFLKRDPRAKERKKPGLVKARKRKQWSKR